MKLYRAVSKDDYESYVKEGGIAPSTNLPGVERPRIYLGTRSYSEEFLDIYLPSWEEGVLLEVDVDIEMLPTGWTGHHIVPDETTNVFETHVEEFIPMSRVSVVDEKSIGDEENDNNHLARF